MSVIEAFLLLIIGFVIGVPASMVGLGGGFIIVPMLILIFRLPAQNAIAISLVAISGTSFSATIGYLRQKRVDFKLSLLYDLLDIPGVIIGAYLTTIFSSNVLTGICGFFIASISLLLVKRGEVTPSSVKNREVRLRDKGWRRRVVDSSGRVFEYAIHKPGLVLISSFMSGFVAGLCGLGGGITDTATMVLLCVPPHVAVASSELAMALTNGAGVITHGLLENILLEYAFPITMGTIIGAQMGCLLAKRVKGKALKSILSAIAFLLGLRLILSLFNI